MKRLWLFILIALASCAREEEQQSAFYEVSPELSGVDFINNLAETEDFNILEYLYFYNGSGVAIGDINNDQLPDIFFGSNQGSDKLFLNKGDLKFEDVSDFFEPDQLLGWSTGVNMIDINGDGWLDIYVCKLGNYKHHKTHNKLFINQNGEKFVESSEAYNLDFSGFGTQSSFFDYDNDGDLDCYLLNHSVKSSEQFSDSKIRTQKDELAGDLMMENVGSSFIDVTEKANIFSSALGFGLGIAASDLNDDGWIDIYVSNDFHEQDYLYINNGDKTFTEVIVKTTGHTSNFSMGCAIGDINNDNLQDILTLDMKPMDDVIYKESGGWESFQIYNYKRSFGYHHQSPRNALQIQNPSASHLPFFSEQAAYYDIAATDWSWCPLIADFDNDGDSDIFITNGIVRRPNNMDFIDYQFSSSTLPILEKLTKMPSGELPNVYFENDRSSNSFSKQSVGLPSSSTGAAYADLNQDGLLEIVINSINRPATILSQSMDKGRNYIQVQLVDTTANISAIGAKVSVYGSGKVQEKLVTNAHGFQSSSSAILHFGLADSVVDSLIVRWPDSKITHVKNVKDSTLNAIRRVEQSTIASLKRINHRTKTVENAAFLSPNPGEAFTAQQSDKWALFHERSFASKFVESDGELSMTYPYDVSARNIPQVLKEEFGAINYCSVADYDADSDKDYLIVSDDATYICKNEDGVFEKSMVSENQVTVAEWYDLDGDGIKEIIMAGLWMPIIIANLNGPKPIVQAVPESNGLWFSLKVMNDETSQQPYVVAGNFGLNHSFRATTVEPFRSYARDFDRNGSTETLVSYYDKGEEKPYPNHKLFVGQLPYAKKRFLKSSDYAHSEVKDLFTLEELKESSQLRVHTFESSVFHLSSDDWERSALPDELQMFPIFAIEDDGNGNVYFGGNLYDVDPNWGRQDAGSLLAYRKEKKKWLQVSQDLGLPVVRGEIRDLIFNRDKLFISMRSDTVKYFKF